MRPRFFTNALSFGFGKFASKKHPKKAQDFINRAYVKLLKIDMSEFDAPESYQSLNKLFTRELKQSRSMPSDPKAVVSPCDSLITEYGIISDQTLFQIKGMSYLLPDLLPHIKKEELFCFDGGNYVNFYLSPRDYHRYHSPLDLKINRLTHIPGRLYPVNMPFLNNKLNLFCENERAVLEGVDENNKKWFLVFVGALNVGKMLFSFMPDFQTNIEIGEVRSFDLDMRVLRGDMLGWFEMGSTVVLIAEKDAIDLSVELKQKIRFGDKIGAIK